MFFKKIVCSRYLLVSLCHKDINFTASNLKLLCYLIVAHENEVFEESLIMLPDFVIGGAQKSASTFLQACVSEHPEIYMPKGEVAFFESPDYEANSIQNLESLFDHRCEKRLGIKRPNYLGKPEVPERLSNNLPGVKLIFVLRNPIDRAMSAYFHYIRGGYIPVADFENGIDSIINSATFREKFKRCKEVIEFGFYFKHLSNYLSFFDRKDILVLLHEDIALSPEHSIRKAYTFLDVSADFLPSMSIKSRPQSVTYNLSRLRLTQKVNLFTNTYNSDKTRSYIKDQNFTEHILSRSILAFDRYVLSRIFGNDKPNIELSLREKLYDVYKDDVLSLENLLERDLNGWKP